MIQEYPQLTQQQIDQLLLIQSNVNQISSNALKDIKAIRSVIVIGNTGDGKSTLLNYLAGNSIIAVPKNKYFAGFFLQLQQPNSNIPIGHSQGSTTKKPNRWVDKQNDTVYWDCPGFNDTQGFSQDIINGYNIANIFNIFAQIKVVLVVSQSNFQSRAQKLITLIKTLAHLYQNVQDIIASLIVVVTKTTLASPQIFKQLLLEDVLSNQKEIVMSQNERKILQFVASQKGRVFLMPIPNKEGPIAMQNRQELKSLISQSKFVEKPIIRIPINSQTKDTLGQYRSTLIHQVSKICLNLNDQMQKTCRNIIETQKTCKSAKKQLMDVIKIIRILKESNNPLEFFNHFCLLMQVYQLGQELNHMLQKSIRLLEFIKLLIKQTQNPILTWSNQIVVQNIIQKLVQPPETLLNQDESMLTLKGFLIGIQQVMLKVEQYKPTIKIVRIFCYDTLFVDQDIKAFGINFMIVSKRCKILGNRQIKLRGKKGQNFENEADSFLEYQNQQGQGIDGKDGLPGNPGQTGGSFYAKIFQQCVQNNDCHKLTIKVNGGRGGNGQNGGSGSNGIPGRDGSIDQVEFRLPKCLVSRQEYDWSKKNAIERINHTWKAVGTFNSQMLETYRSQGQLGKRGGNAGRGGAPGIGGNSGKVILEGIQAYIIQGKGKDGNAGRVGEPGNGGKHGFTYEAQYINESVMTAFREKGQIIKQDQQNEQERLNKKRVLKAPVASLAATTTSTAVKALSASGGVVVTGGLTLGISTGAQMLLSVGSAVLSSGWKKDSKKQIDHGYAQNGSVFPEPNTSGQQFPSQPMEITSDNRNQLSNLFLKQRDSKIKELNSKTQYFM